MAKIPEEVMQSEVLTLIKSGQLYHSIQGIEEIERLNKGDEDYIVFPKFSIDYLLRRKAYRSARFILQSFKSSFSILNGETIRSVSLGKGEYLKPDFLLVNDETQQVIIIELKRERTAERQTVTEITGYAHEVKNHLPFLADYNFLFVIISTEFDTLLQHSVGNLLLNNTHKVLCLKPTIVGHSISGFTIELPNSWLDLDINYLSRSSFFGKELQIQFNNVLRPSKVLATMIDLIVKEGERNHSHGFVLLCQLKDGSYSLKIYILDSYDIFKKSIELDMTPKNKENPLAQFIMNVNSGSGLELTIRRLAESAIRYVEDFLDESTTTWADNSDWERDRLEVMGTVLPTHMDSWGVVSEFVHEIFLHSGASDRFIPEAYLLEKDYKVPEIGLQCIDQITGDELFAFGKIQLRDLFYYGSMLGMCKLISGHSPLSFEMFSFLNWLLIDLAIPSKAIGFRCQDSEKELIPPTLGLTLTPLESIKNNVEQIETYIEWLDSYFLEGNSDVFGQFFNLGVNLGWSLHPVFNRVFEVPEEPLEIAYSHLEKIVKTTLEGIIESYYDESPEKYQVVITTYVGAESFDKKSSLEALLKIDSTSIISRFSIFLDIMTYYTDEVYHKLREVPLHESLDWQILKEKVLEIRSNGNASCGVLRDRTGVFKVFEDRGDELKMINLTNIKENEVIFLDESRLVPMARIVTWDFFINGNYA